MPELGRELEGVSFQTEPNRKRITVGVLTNAQGFEKQQSISPHLRVLGFLFQSAKLQILTQVNYYIGRT